MTIQLLNSFLEACVMIATLSHLMHGWRKAAAGVPGYAERRTAYEMTIRAHWRAIVKGLRT